jgi:hypothetical protein
MPAAVPSLSCCVKLHAGGLRARLCKLKCMRTICRIIICSNITLIHWTQAFLAALQPGGKGAIPGFPIASAITTASALARIAAQVRVKKLSHLCS